MRVRNENRQQNRMSMFLSGLIVFILLAIIAFNGLSLYRRLQEGEARKAELTEEIAAEEQRAREIEEYREYTQTDEFIQEIARQKLGLVYEGEIVFKEDTGK